MPPIGRYTGAENKNDRLEHLIMGLHYVEVTRIRQKIQDGHKLSSYERKSLKLWHRSAVTEAEEAKLDRVCKAILRRSQFYIVKDELA